MQKTKKGKLMPINSNPKPFVAENYSVVCVGAGFAGSVFAREMAERLGYRVAVLERRDHVGGNAYDERDAAGILVHRYGPHIFHSDNTRVFDYLSRFTEWLPYEHRVLANVYGTHMPVPFNRTGLSLAFGPVEGERYYRLLTEEFGEGKKVRLAELLASRNEELAEVARYVHDNIFLHYTQKQWDMSPEEIDPKVTGRVPVYVGDDDRYFHDKYQGMPAKGYTALFESLLDHDKIDVFLNCDALDLIGFEDGYLTLDAKRYGGIVLYTGALDELFQGRFGGLPYRSLDMRFETHDQEFFQPAATVNYTTTEAFTRISEFKRMTGDVNPRQTTILKEYSQAYVPEKGMTPYYPIPGAQNQELYEKYRALADKIPGFYVLGRLAEYRYYDMDDVVEAALVLADEIVELCR